MTRKYTAQEMRELAESDDFAAYLYDDPKRCPDPDFAEDDITQMVRDMLRQAADMMEQDGKREKRYEYAAMFMRKSTGKCVGKSASHYDSIEEAKRNHKWPLVGEDVVFARREVGKLEKVPND